MQNSRKKSSVLTVIALIAMLALTLLFGTACGDTSSKNDTPKEDETSKVTLTVNQYGEGEQFAGKYYVEMGTYPQTKCEVANPQLVANKTYKFNGAENTVYTDGTNEYVMLNDSYFKIEPVKWIIVGDENGNALPQNFTATSKGVYTVISEKVLVQQIFNSGESLNNKWNGSAMQQFLNNDFMNDLFTADEKSAIKSTELTTTYSDAEGAKEEVSTDNMFLLGIKKQIPFGDTVDRTGNYNIDLLDTIADDEKLGTAHAGLVAKPTDLAKATGSYNDPNGATYWWLRSGDFEQKDSVCNVLESGKLDSQNANYDNCGVRAAFRINL